MKKLDRIVLFLATFILFTTIGLFAQSTEKQFQSLLDSVYLAHPASIGILVRVEAPMKGISWSGAIGFAEKEKSTVLHIDQPALIASNTKTYVSAAILRLVEDKKLNIDQPIQNLLSKKTRSVFKKGGYNLESIKIRHLLSHTSGIQNYANQEYINFISENPKHRWTRDEQLELTIQTGPPLGPPGNVFNYSDANYLLLTEVIEGITGQNFYMALKSLLRYEALGLNHTWFPTLEEKPIATSELVHQYWGAQNWDSQEIDISVDLYGGGGIACTMKDMATFTWQLFNSGIVEDTAVFNLIYTETITKDPEPSDYYFGLSGSEFNGYKAYGHSGFWGTVAMYFPELKTAVTICVLEKDEATLRYKLIEEIIRTLGSK